MNNPGFSTRIMALIHKEIRQMLRDRSNLVVGLLLPVILILLFGYGLSFDVKNARVTVVLEDHSQATYDIAAGLQGSPYIALMQVGTMKEAERLMHSGKTDAILRFPGDFSRQQTEGSGKVQLLLNGIDSTTASTIEGYVNGALLTSAVRQNDRTGNQYSGVGSVTVIQRIWFNELEESTWYLVPGLIVLVMTLIGAFLTSMLVAREWERGTLEPLFVTPVRPLELVLSKLAPYIIIGAIDLMMCLLAAKLLFRVPMRGSFTVIVISSLLYLIVALAIGLYISAATRNQFVSSQVALLVSFMPAMMLSGFVFDLRNVPGIIRIISYLLPATHFMSLIKTLFMAGDIWSDILKNDAVLIFYIFVLIIAARSKLRKTLE